MRYRRGGAKQGSLILEDLYLLRRSYVWQALYRGSWYQHDFLNQSPTLTPVSTITNGRIVLQPAKVAHVRRPRHNPLVASMVRQATEGVIVRLARVPGTLPVTR